MRARAGFVGILLLIALAIPTRALAALRSPQVPVLGTVLQSYLDQVNPGIDVHAHQDQQQVWRDPNPNNAFFVTQLELTRKPAGVSVGVYVASAASPVRYRIFPDGAGPGWFAIMNFRHSPDRLIVNLFDVSVALVSSTTYLGAAGTEFGFYLENADGVLYSEDARNPGSEAQWLAFAGQDLYAGSWWVAGEATPVASGASDRDYADVVMFIEGSDCNCVPVQRSTWGAVKARFR